MNYHRLVRLIVLASITLCVSPLLLMAMEFQYTVEFSRADFIFDKVMNYDIVSFKDGDWINIVGKPMLPAKEIKIAVPAGMAVTGIRVVNNQSMPIIGEYTIFPSQPPRRTSIANDHIPFVKPDEKTYLSANPYPLQLVEFVNQTDLAGQGIAVIRLYPLQYIPSEKMITLNIRICFVIEGTHGYKCGDYLSSEKDREKYERIVKDMVINPADVRLSKSPNGSPVSRTLTGGPYEHVVISRSADTTYWKPLAEWYTKRGLRSTIVTTSWIYSNYTGSDNQQKIRNFIIEADKSVVQGGWETDYVLICGEDGDVPFKDKTYVSESIPSDQYYGDYDDDWIYEVYVGRSTARGSTEINRFINKVLKYEKAPPLTNYTLDVTLLGMDLSTVAFDGYLTRGEYLKRRIDDWYVPSRFVIDSIYDTHASNHRTDFINALNDGQNLVNHADHGNSTVMCTGDRNHGWYISNTTVDGFTNNDRMSIIYSVGCHCNEMDYNDCIAEHFVIYNDLQAGIAFTGNTRSGWFYLGDPYSLSFQLDQYWWRGLFDYQNNILGEALAYTKNNCPYSDQYWRYVQWTLNLLGEPAMPIWTTTPDSLNVTHPATLPVGTSSFLVHVEDFSRANIEHAYVCLWKGNEVYERGHTNSSGDVTFYPTPTTEGNMYVTVTKYDFNDNYLPYEGTALVGSGAEYTLTVNISGSGSVTKNPDLPTYPHGTLVELTADPDSGWQFDHWTGGLSGSQNPDTITMDGDKTVTAHFVEAQYTLTINVNGSGSVDKDPDLPSYPYGTDVELTANPNLGWSFDHWSGALSGSQNPDTITMDDDKTVTAHFTQDHYTLTVTIDGNGSVTKYPDWPTYTYGIEVQLSATADLGWNFDHWSGALTGNQNPDTVFMDSNESVTAHFTQAEYTLTVNTEGSGLVEKDPDQTYYYYGDQVILTAHADTGWIFDHWSGDLEGSQNPDTITIDDNKTVTAHFIEEQHIIENQNEQVEVTFLDVFPNPFHDKITIKYGIAQTGSATSADVKIYDVTGQLIKRITLPATYSTVIMLTWDGRDNTERKASSGVYFLKFSAGDYEITKQILLLR